MSRITLVMAALLGFALVGSGPAHAATATTSPQKMLTFEGDIVSLDVPAQDFTVRNVDNGRTYEMRFHVEDPIGVHMDGQVVLLSELRKGDRVTVTYEASGETHVARNVHRHMKRMMK